MGFEDEAPSIEQINNDIAVQKKQAEIKRLETLAQSEKNLNEHQEKQRKFKELVQVLGIENMQHEIDDIKTALTKQDQSITYLAQRSDEMIKAINNLVVAVQGGQQTESNLPAPQTQPGLTPQTHLHTLLQLLESPIGEKVLGRLFPENTAPGIAPLISQDVINQKMTKAFMDDLETGESIRSFISDTLKKKATQTIVKQSLGNFSNVPTIHEPE